MEGHAHGAPPQKNKATPVAELAGKTYTLTKLDRQETKSNLAHLDLKRMKLDDDEERYKRVVVERALARVGIFLKKGAPLPVFAMAPDGAIASFTFVHVTSKQDGNVIEVTMEGAGAAEKAAAEAAKA